MRPKPYAEIIADLARAGYAVRPCNFAVYPKIKRASTRIDAPTWRPNSQEIDELLDLAHVSTRDGAERRWIGDALVAAHALARSKPRPCPAEHNKPLDAIERSAHQLLVALDQLEKQPHAHRNFWSSVAFGSGKYEDVKVFSALKNTRSAARSARVSGIGRPPDRRKQHIVNFALAFSARFSSLRPSSDEGNFFRLFAERFFECTTGLSIEDKGRGIGRQTKVALRRLPIETARAAALRDETRRE